MSCVDQIVCEQAPKWGTGEEKIGERSVPQTPLDSPIFLFAWEPACYDESLNSLSFGLRTLCVLVEFCALTYSLNQSVCWPGECNGPLLWYNTRSLSLAVVIYHFNFFTSFIFIAIVVGVTVSNGSPIYEEIVFCGFFKLL